MKRAKTFSETDGFGVSFFKFFFFELAFMRLIFSVFLCSNIRKLAPPPLPITFQSWSWCTITISASKKLGHPKARGDTARKIGGGMRHTFQNPKPVLTMPKPIYDQNLRFSIIHLWPDQKVDSLFMTVVACTQLP